MRSRWFRLTALLLLAPLGWANGATLPRTRSTPPRAIPDDVSFPQRLTVDEIMDKASLWARGPGESFRCDPEHYLWFLDHPDRAVIAWRRMGAKCVTIVPKGENTFGWSD